MDLERRDWVLALSGALGCIDDITYSRFHHDILGHALSSVSPSTQSMMTHFDGSSGVVWIIIRVGQDATNFGYWTRNGGV
jgi:hypothetical protein